MSDNIEESDDRMKNASLWFAFGVTTMAYVLKTLNWIPCLFESLCPNLALIALVGIVDWMGGPVDMGFYTFMAIEGAGYVIFATRERNRLKREAAKFRDGWDEERRQREKAERRAAEAERQAAEAERRAAELQKQLDRSA